ncbi:Protein of unknown function [Lactobacillus delbrueckii subsp. bulgaricus]|nr:Protein of unknown function [Lactobacillus delbrueckii subsp. bulgaricus]
MFNKNLFNVNMTACCCCGLCLKQSTIWLGLES